MQKLPKKTDLAKPSSAIYILCNLGQGIERSTDSVSSFMNGDTNVDL